MEMRAFLMGSLQTAISNASGPEKRRLMDTMATYMEDVARQDAQKQADNMTREQIRTKYLMSQKLKANKRAQWIASDRKAAGDDDLMVQLKAALDAMSKTLADLMEG